MSDKNNTWSMLILSMQKTDTSEIEFHLKKIFSRYRDFFIESQWPSEHSRWIELIFALLTRISSRPQTELRDVLDEMDDIGLLEVKALSEIPEVKGGIDLSSSCARHLFEVLIESGFTKKESENSILIMHEAAKTLEKFHDGKIQRYLRKYGRQMINEISENFTFSTMDRDDVKYAFSLWLQNVLNMPISMTDHNVMEFCDKFNIGINDLVEAADRLDINLAIVDDLIKLYLDEEKARKEES